MVNFSVYLNRHVFVMSNFKSNLNLSLQNDILKFYFAFLEETRLDLSFESSSRRFMLNIIQYILVSSKKKKIIIIKVSSTVAVISALRVKCKTVFFFH